MFNVRLAGGHLYGKQLFTWLSLVVSFMASFVLPFFPLDVLDGIWDLIKSVSEGFLTYSIVKIIQTDLRSDMNNDTLCALLSCKLNQSTVCYAFCPTSESLSLAESATDQYNREHLKAKDETRCTE